jgi:hypothetical protein
MMKKSIMVALMVAALALSANTATASWTMDSDVGSWTGTNGGTNVGTQTVGVGYGNGSQDQIRWGIPYPDSVPNTIDNQSGLGFTGKAAPALAFEVGEVFEIGQITHFNHEIRDNGSPTEAYLELVMNFTTPDGTATGTFNFTFGVDETPILGVPDIITFPNAIPEETMTINGQEYTLELVGFGDSPEALINQFVSPENGLPNSTLLWGRVTSTAVPLPGTVVLGSIGLGFVGYLRRRRAL